MGAHREPVQPEKEAVKPPAQQKPNNLHIATPVKTKKEHESVAKMIAKKVAEAALILVLSPVAIVSGCSPTDTGPPGWREDAGKEDEGDAGVVKDAGQTDAGPKEKLEWWPGYLYDPKVAKLSDVSLGFKEGQTYLCQLTGCFASEGEIPQSIRDEKRATVSGAIEYSDFFLKKEVFNSIIGNNVVTVFPGNWGDSGGYGDKATGFKMLNKNGEVIANCFDGCSQYNEVSIRPDVGNVVFFHELLHDVWGTWLSDEGKREFQSNARLFFNAVGNDYATDRSVRAIWIAAYSNESGETVDLPFYPGLAGRELNDWGRETGVQDAMDQAGFTGLKSAMAAYFEIWEHAINTRTKDLTAEQRDYYLYGEGFPHIAASDQALDELYNGAEQKATRPIPAFMKGTYSAIMNEEHVDALANPGSGYFETAESFATLAPYLQSFVDWMKAKYPEIP